MNVDAQSILIRNRGTDLFLIGDYDWTLDKEKARQFKTPAEAIAHCSREQLATAQIVVKSSAPGATDVIIPIEIRVKQRE